MSVEEGAARTRLGVVFAGRRGRLLIAPLLAGFGAAVQGIAYSTVLPLAARDLHGSRLYGATLAAGPLSTVFILAAGWGAVPRLGARGNLAFATGLYVIGVVLSATAGSMGWLVVACRSGRRRSAEPDSRSAGVRTSRTTRRREDSTGVVGTSSSAERP